MPDITSVPQPLGEYRFPPVAKSHIIHCSYDQWFPKYRASCIKTQIIPLTTEFVAYIKEDGILLADDTDVLASETADEEWHTDAVSSGFVTEVYSDDDSEDGEPEEALLPPNLRFPELHGAIKKAIEDLGGSVVPKLNWSTPKDAAWISPHQNTLKCTTPNDIYLLLKSSSFISHDLDHAFDDTIDDVKETAIGAEFQPVLVLRPFFNPHPALEFRCFVKYRSLIGICQRDLNHYDFLENLREAVIDRVDDFFESKLRLTFPDDSFVFDVYIPEDHSSTDDSSLGRVRLIDINPWASTTDSIMFDWSELLNFNVPKPLIGPPVTSPETEDFVRLKLDGSNIVDILTGSEEDDGYVEPELRLVAKDDPSAYNFSSTQYSAHKLPKEVVDASMAGNGGLREFAKQWDELTAGRGGDMFKPPQTQ